MRVEISEFEKKYSFEMASITQICGQNIPKKTYIFESLRRYFSTYKYSEEKNKWRDNVTIDNETVGRKYFSIISIKDVSDIIQMIKWSKQSLMIEYVKNLMQKFDWQLYLRTINEEVAQMFQILNEDIGKLGDIELTYSLSEVWDMIQKSSVSGIDDTELEDKNNYDLMCILLNLIKKVLGYSPKKTMVIFENIDHMISKKEYVDILDKAQIIARKFDIYFLFSSSIDGYVLCNEELCSGIVILGDVDFQMPEFENICKFVRENYPYEKELSDIQIQNILAGIIQKIGQQEYLNSVEESVVCKLINQSLLLFDKISYEGKKPELAFLKS